MRRLRFVLLLGAVLAVGGAGFAVYTLTAPPAVAGCVNPNC
jgi:hypothetical protein